MGKYAYCADDMFLREDHPRRPGRAGTWIFGQEIIGQEYVKEAPNMAEMLYITGNYMMMNGFPEGIARRTFNMGDHKGGPFPKTNHGCNKTMIFCGTDCDDLHDLGAHVEFHLGQGKDEEVFEFDQPKAILIPKGVRYGPIYITKFRRPLIVFNMYDVNTKEACKIEDDWDFVGDEAKMKEVIGDDMEQYRKFFGSDQENPFKNAKMTGEDVGRKWQQD